MPRVVVHRRSVLQREYNLSGSHIVVIGRHQTNDIVLPDISRKVSRHHAALVRIPSEDRYFVRDLGSLRGTRVGGHMVDRRVLRDGDVIAIGDYALVFSSAVAASVAPKIGLIEMVSRKRVAIADAPTREYQPTDGSRREALTPDRTELLDHLRRQGASGSNLQALLAAAAALVVKVMGADRGFIRLFLNGDATSYEDLGATGFTDGDRIEIADSRFMEQVLAGLCVREGTTLLAPVLSQGRSIGFVCLDRHRGLRPFTGEEGEFLIDVGRRATAVANDDPDPCAKAAGDGPIAWEQQIVGKSKKAQDLLTAIREASKGDTNVLLIGETGSGKELAARAIQQESDYATGPFIKRHCGQTTEAVAEPELFGYAPKVPLANADPAGAPGWFEMAHGGTLLLDEIQSLGTSMQEKFLRVLDEKEIWRYGARQATPVDVKVIAATSVVDIEAAMEKGRFEKALYYRFRHVVKLPPLRERLEDVPLLAFYLLDRHAAALGAKTRSISRRALQILSTYRWPGNVRELDGVILKAVTRNGEVVFSWDLDIPSNGAPAGLTAVTTGDLRSGPLGVGAGHGRSPVTMREVEREKIMEALEATQGNITQAWKLLGYGSRMTILNKMDQLGIPRNYGDPNRGVSE